MNHWMRSLAMLCVGTTGCLAEEPPQSYEYLTYRAYDSHGVEVENAGFIAESVFIPLGFGQRPPKRFAAESGGCAELLSRVKIDHVRLAYAAYRSDEGSSPLATIKLQCFLFRGYDQTCLRRLEESIRRAIDQVVEKNPEKAGEAEILGLALLEKKKSENCVNKETISPAQEFRMED